MPRYLFRCACGATTAHAFSMRDLPAAAACAACGAPAARLYTPPHVGVSALRSDANRRGLAEMNATRRADERSYARRWDRPLPKL